MKIRWIISAVLIAVAVVGISFADTWMKDTGYEINGTTLDFDIWQQLHNIGATTISATQWGYLGGQDQAVATTSAPTFATVNTGQGANELYAMNQNVRTTDSPTFDGLILTDTITGLNYTINANSLQEGLVGYWGFEYGSGGTAYDSSREENDGTLVGMDNSTCWVAGKDGTALKFDGVDDFIDFGNLTIEEEITFSFWAKHENYSLQSLLSKYPNTAQYFHLSYNLGKLYLYTKNSSGSTGTLSIGISSDFTPGEWEHIAVTISPSNVVTAFVNGEAVSVSGAVYFDDCMNNAGNLFFGKRAAFNDQYYNGSIDNLRIYNRTLTEEEVRALYYGLGSQPTGHLALK